MNILIALISLYTIAGLAALLNRATGKRLCPICAGAAGTWIWMLALYFGGWHPAGFTIDLFVPTILMGGSVVGIAYQAEKYLAPHIKPLAWKMIFIPAGFTAVYGVTQSWWWILLLALTVMLVTAAICLRVGKSGGSQRRVEDLEKKMEQCC
ncbi:MAG: hypothetical protein HW383_112 [Candidatus Magasanikbacteria bacterium]|nr:hypothetical protein [Candidatus Magasanikbacteria bacterium]